MDEGSQRRGLWVAGGFAALLVAGSTVWFAVSPEPASEEPTASVTSVQSAREANRSRPGWKRDANARHDPGADPTKGVGSRARAKAPITDPFAKEGKARAVAKRQASGTGGSAMSASGTGSGVAASGS
jgi:hypothetical protein